MSEELYDRIIAPRLAEVGKLCEEHGLSLLVACEWEPGEWGETRTMQPDASGSMLLISGAMQANGNFDALTIAVSRYAREHGHSSGFLMNAGVPLEPEVQP